MHRLVYTLRSVIGIAPSYSRRQQKKKTEATAEKHKDKIRHQLNIYNDKLLKNSKDNFKIKYNMDPIRNDKGITKNRSKRSTLQKRRYSV